jgi:hypothetical protein
MPESLMLLAVFGGVSALGLLWRPLLLALVPLVGMLIWILSSALAHGWQAHQTVPHRSRRQTLERRLLTALLFVLQPCARLAGRLRNGLSPWRRRLRPGAALPRPKTLELWSEDWRDPQVRVEQLQDALAERGGFVRSGGPFDRWDLEVRTGPLGGVKLRIAVEEHGRGRQLVRARVWPRVSAGDALVALALALLAALAWHEGRSGFAIAIGAALVTLIVLALEGQGTAMSLVVSQVSEIPAPDAAAAEQRLPATVVRRRSPSRAHAAFAGLPHHLTRSMRAAGRPHDPLGEKRWATAGRTPAELSEAHVAVAEHARGPLT